MMQKNRMLEIESTLFNSLPLAASVVTVNTRTILTALIIAWVNIVTTLAINQE